MILTGLEIERWIKLGSIKISDFDRSRLNPNSYNLRLHNELLVYENDIIDMKKENPVKRITIPEDGFIMQPGELYLGRTVEYTETNCMKINDIVISSIIPIISGRSSIGRLGINVHATAGYGDVGFKGTWTLELSCVKPVVIYPNVEICQIYYTVGTGDVEPDFIYHGKYKDQMDIMDSRLFTEFK